MTGHLADSRTHAPVRSMVSPDVIPALSIAATAALYYLIGPTLPSLALLALLAYLCWRRVDLAVTLIPLSIPLWMLPKHIHVVRNLDFSLGETAIVLCTAIVLAQQLRTLAARPTGLSVREHFLPPTAFERPAFVFLLAAALSTIAAHFHTVAWREFREVVVEPMLFYWLVQQRLQGRAGAVRLILIVIATGVGVAALGVGQLLFRSQDLAYSPYVSGPALHLVRAVYGNENNLALFLDRALPMALALALCIGWLPLVLGTLSFGRSTSPQSADSMDSASSESRMRIALLLGSALMGIIIYKTNSRGGELALGLCLAVLFVLWQWRRPQMLVAGGVVLAAAAFVARHRLQTLFTSGHGLSNDARISVWNSALHMIRDHPLFGVGPDNFLYYYSNNNTCAPGHLLHWYYNQKNAVGVPVNMEPCLSHPHNLFLDLWLSTGLLGLVAGLWLLALCTALGLRAYLQADAAWKGPILAVLLAMLAFVAHGMVDNSYFLPDLAVLFWLCLAVIALSVAERA